MRKTTRPVAPRPTVEGPHPQEPSPPVLEEISHRLMGHRSDFRAFLQRRVSDAALAEDLLQQSLMRAVERHRDLHKADNAVGWFYRILRNTVVDYYRSHAAEGRKTEGLLRELVTKGEDKTPALDELRPTVCTCLDVLLTNLRPAYADLIRRIDLQGESAAAVARDLGVTPNNLTVRLHRARQALKAGLEQACGICTKHGCLNCTCASQEGNPSHRHS